MNYFKWNEINKKISRQCGNQLQDKHTICKSKRKETNQLKKNLKIKRGKINLKTKILKLYQFCEINIFGKNYFRAILNK